MTKVEIVAYLRANAGDDAALCCAIVKTESDFNCDAFLFDSNGGSYGLCQLDYPTAKDRGYTGDRSGLYDPITNLDLGIKHVKWIRATLEKHEIFALESIIAAYNEGVGNVLKGRPDPQYVERVLGFLPLFTITANGGIVAPKP